MNSIFSIKEEKLYVKIVIFIIIAIFLSLCFATFAYHGDNMMLGNYDDYENDDVKYLRSAWTFLETGHYTYRYPDIDTIFIMPGLTTVLAGFVALFGKYPYLPFKIFQALLVGLGLYIIFLIGRKIFNSKVGLIAAGLMAVYAPSIYVTNIILTESIFYILFLIMFLYTLHALDTDKMYYYAMGGVFLGLCALFRPTILLFPVVVFVMWLIKKYRFLDMLIFGGTVVGIVCIILSPWIIRNAVVFNKFIPLTLSSGNPTLQGTFIDYDQSVIEQENIDYYKIIEAKGEINVDLYGQDEIATDAIEAEMAKIRIKEVMTKDPWAYLKWYTVGKTIKNWDRPFLWKRLFDLNQENLFFMHYVLLVFAGAGFMLALVRRNLKGLALVPVLAVIYFNLAHLPFYCFSRYVFPVMFCMALFTGYLFYDIGKIIKDRSFVNKL